MDAMMDLPESQKALYERLALARSGGTFPGALLLVGMPGIGKKRLAMALARLLSCAQPGNATCQQHGTTHSSTCFACRSIDPTRGETPWLWLTPHGVPQSDLDTLEKRTTQTLKCVESYFAAPWSMGDPAATIRINSVRDLQGRFQYREEGVRVVLIPDCDRMPAVAANALLKTLEEVPRGTHFILTTSRRSALLPTVRSRCLQMHVPHPSVQELRSVLLAQGKEVNSFEELWALSGGSPGRALELVEQGVEEQLGKVLEFLRALRASDELPLIEWVDGQADLGDREELLLAILQVAFADWARQEAGALPRLKALAAGGELASPGPVRLLAEMNAALGELRTHLKQNVVPNQAFLAFGLRLRNLWRLPSEVRVRGRI